jgi:hypothetical protein
MNILIILALAIIATLAITAGYYLFKVRQVTRQEDLQSKENQQAWLLHRNNLIKDIHFIANSMTQEQCEITEGCMRLEYLIGKVDDSEQIRASFSHIYGHFNATAHMPIKDAYQSLSKKEQFKLDKERSRLEVESKAGVLEDSKRLSQHAFS